MVPKIFFDLHKYILRITSFFTVYSALNYLELVLTDTVGLDSTLRVVEQYCWCMQPDGDNHWVKYFCQDGAALLKSP